MKLKIITGILLMQILSTFAPSQINAPTVWHDKPVNVERINTQLTEYAETFKADAPIARMVLFDIAYPQSEAEFEVLDGYAVLMVTALSQKEKELPLKSVFVLSDGKRIELENLKLFLSKISDSKDKIKMVFGSNRADALYLFPVYLRMKKARIMAEFANFSTPLQIVGFDGLMPESLGFLPNKAPTGNGYSKELMDKFIKKVYPAFFVNESPDVSR
ncbi:hypothetical protein BH10ACI1_BH10ACI1_28120 [soil metagenome]